MSYYYGASSSAGKIQTAAFAPDDIANLLFWHDGGLSNKTYHSGSIVSQWDDLSGNARHWTQATSGNAPEDGTVTINNIPALNFNGTDDFMTMGTGHGITTVAHLFVVAIIDVQGTNDMLLHAGANTDGDDGFMLRQSSSSGQTALLLSDGSSARRTFSSGASVTFTAGAASLFEARFDGTNEAALAIDGTEFTDASGTGCTGPDDLGLWAQASGANFSDGSVALTLGYGAIISGTDLTNLRSYINTRFGL